MKTPNTWKVSLDSFPSSITFEPKWAHASATCFRRRSNMRMKQFRFISSSSQSKSIVLPPGCPKFLKGLRNGLRTGLRNGLWKGLWNGLSMLCWTRRPGSEATLTYKKECQHRCSKRAPWTVFPAVTLISSLSQWQWHLQILWTLSKYENKKWNHPNFDYLSRNKTQTFAFVFFHPIKHFQLN